MLPNTRWGQNPGDWEPQPESKGQRSHTGQRRPRMPGLWWTGDPQQGRRPGVARSHINPTLLPKESKTWEWVWTYSDFKNWTGQSKSGWWPMPPPPPTHKSHPSIPRGPQAPGFLPPRLQEPSQWEPWRSNSALVLGDFSVLSQEFWDPVTPVWWGRTRKEGHLLGTSGRVREQGSGPGPWDLLSHSPQAGLAL